jgi:hypothetical protein
MGLSRSALRVETIKSHGMSRHCMSATAYFDQALICIRHPPRTGFSKVAVTALLYHEVGHLIDRATKRRRALLDWLIPLVALSAVLCAGLSSYALLVGIAIWLDAPALPALAIIISVCLYIGMGVGHWCQRWALWDRLYRPISHMAENNANRLAVDALLGRADCPDIRAVAHMLINLKFSAQRRQKVAAGHPSARQELATLCQHLLTRHGLCVAFTSRPRSGAAGPSGQQRAAPQQRLFLRNTSTGLVVLETNFAFDNTTPRFRPLRQRRRQQQARSRAHLEARSLWWCLAYGPAHDTAASVRQMVARLSTTFLGLKRRWALIRK